jgi:Spy/CpxP family protein refolding chaperone
MRTLWITVALSTLLACPKLFAQGGRERLAERMQDLGLSAQQETKIADIRKEFQPKVKADEDALSKVVQAEVEQARAVLTPDQRTRLAAMRDERREGRQERREERRESRADRREGRLSERLARLQQLDLTDAETAKIKTIRDEYTPKVAKAMETLKGTLTPDQLRAREEALREGKKRTEVIAALHLSGDQKEKVEAVGNELRTLVREELEKIRDVLTEGQQEKLQEFKDERKDHVRDRMAHRIMNAKELNLTDDEEARLTAIRKEFRPKIQEAGNKLRSVVREELESIVAVLKD